MLCSMCMFPVPAIFIDCTVVPSVYTVLQEAIMISCFVFLLALFILYIFKYFLYVYHMEIVKTTVK